MSNQPTKVITGKVRLSYCHVFQPTSMGGEDPKYSVCLLIDKNDKTTIDKMNAAIKEAEKIGVQSKWDGKKPMGIKLPLRDGDLERGEDHPEYVGKMFVNASCKTKPGVVDRDTNPILDSTEVYSGCYARASVNFYAFNTKGNKGIACGLNNIQKLADGDSLGGRSRAEDDFEVITDEDLLS